MFRNINEWRKRPAEELSYRLPIFITVVILVGLTVWSVWDETIKRRPWKLYQKEFFRLELEKVTEEYAQEKNNFESPDNRKKYEELKDKLTLLKEGPQDPSDRTAYLQAKDKLVQVRYKLEDFSRDAQFIKSRYDAAYYLYEKARIEEPENVDREKQKVDQLQKEMDEVSKQIKAVESQSQTLWKLVQAHDELVSKTERELALMTVKLEALEKKIADVKSKKPTIQQVVIKDLNRVDRCQTCHLAIDRPGFEDAKKFPQPFTTHPKLEALLKKHPPEKFACTICHQGQGPALTVEAAHGEVHHWEFPLLRGQNVESSCRKCHTFTVETPEAPVLSHGRKLFSSLGCVGCHLAPGYEDARKVGPELTNVHQKTTLNWIERWVQDPRNFKPTTRMPQFKVTQGEAASMAHYLASVSEPKPLTEEEKNILTKGNSEEGKRLFTELACIGCHRIGEEGGTFAPNLTYVGSKVRPEWLFHYLKNPREYSPKGKMPVMRLKEEEVAHLATYLLTLKKEGQEAQALNIENEEKPDPVKAEEGKRLMGTFGCHGCHVIPGLENRPRVGAELSSFGAKDLSLLFFGYANHVPHTLRDWAFNKIKNPQVYATERIEQKMPNFYLADDEAKSLVTLLTSFRGDEKEIPVNYLKALNTKERDIEGGRSLVRELNCTGCHKIEDVGADIAPNLAGEGAKVQPEWMFKFIKNPIAIRPWLAVRMPKFNLNDDEAGRLVSYFSALAQAQYPYEFDYFNKVEVSDRERKAGEKLFEMFKCISCHPVSMDESSKGNQVVNLGPNLGLAKDRLRHSWISQWILQPEVLQPGTKMPTNFPKMGDKRISFIPNLVKTPKFQDLKTFLTDLYGPDLDAFLADASWQTRAIRDYIISLSSEPQSQKPVVKEPVAPESISQANESNSNQ